MLLLMLLTVAQMDNYIDDMAQVSLTGDDREMKVQLGNGGEVVDLADGTESREIGVWQFDGGPDGWLQCSDTAQEVVEQAYASGLPTVRYTDMYGSYCVSLAGEHKQQQNVSSGTVRRIRRICF